jgi:hypothetical protein
MGYTYGNDAVEKCNCDGRNRSICSARADRLCRTRPAAARPKPHRFHPEADEDYADAATHYATISPELGGRFYDEIERRIAI